MKSLLFEVETNPEYSFSIKHQIVPYLYNQWHYHPEAELIHIIKGSGKRFINNEISNFGENDLILLGANLPHLFKNDDPYFDNKSDLRTESVILHFLPEIFGNSFLNLPENRPVNKLLEDSKQGLLITGDTKQAVVQLMTDMRYAAKKERIIMLMQILNVLAYAPDNVIICKKSGTPHLNKTDETRLNRVYQYTLNNFTHEIKLEDVAAIVYMVPHSFCRYFKQRSGKRYSEFILEVRVRHACKLLAETGYSIAVVCYESGFKNFSNFNRYFKSITGTSPLEYRKNYYAVGIEAPSE